MAQFSISNTTNALKRYGLRHSDCVYLSRYISKQISNRGKEGASTFLKALGNQLINYVAKNGKRTPWVKCDKGGFPSAMAPFKGCTKIQLQAIAKMARRIILDNVSKEQLRKVVSGIVSAKAFDNTTRMSHLIQIGSSSLGLYSKSSQPCDPSRVTRTVKRFVTTGDNHRIPNLVSHTTAPVKKSFEVLKHHQALQDLPYMQEAFYPLTKESVDKILTETPLVGDNSVGIICGQQEGGAKLRAFAAPSTIVQSLMYPIHYWIADYLKDIPNCCTYEQERGALEAQRRLSSGSFVQSVDLSTATCRFPLDVQLELLASLGLKPVFIKALETVSRAQWRVLSGMGPFNGTHLAWSVGQPLGLAPSMSMFSLTHICLIAGICRELGVPSSAFYVLGDDVVIFNEDVYNMYTETMITHGVEISWGKTHNSSEFAEFAGYSITSSSLFRPGQMKDITHDNLLSTIHDWGAQDSLSNHWNLIQKYYLWKLGRLDMREEPKNLTKFIKANSNKIYHSLDFHPKFGTDWYRWCTNHINNVYPDMSYYTPRRVNPMYMTTVFPKGNPFFDSLIEQYYLKDSFELEDWYRPTFQVSIWNDITIALGNSVRGCFLTFDEALLLKDRLEQFVTQDFVIIDVNQNISALDSLDKELKGRLSPIEDKRFISTRVKQMDSNLIQIEVAAVIHKYSTVK